MMNQTFNEWKKNKTSLFVEIADLLETDIFNIEEVGFLDEAFSHLYGNRQVQTAIIDDSITSVAKKIVYFNRNKWIKSYELLYNEIVNGVANETIVQDENTNINNRILDRNTKENVSAFNDVDYSPDSENVEGLTDENTQSGNSTRNEKRKSLWAIQEQLRMANQSFLKDVVFKDVSKVVTLPIY